MSATLKRIRWLAWLQCGADDSSALAVELPQRVHSQRPPIPRLRLLSARPMVGPTLRTAVRLGLLLAMCAVLARAAEPGPTPPDRRELWIPVDKVARVLGGKAMLLTREQYETLLRDAGIEKPSKPQPPAGVALSNAIFRAVPDGKTAAIHAELTINVLREGWVELPLEFPGAAVGEVKLEGEAVLMPASVVAANAKEQAPARRPAMLVIRGLGQHRLSLDITVPIQNVAGVSSLALGVPGVASGTFALVLPAGSTVEKLGQAVKISDNADATTASLALSSSPQPIALAWKNAASGGAAQVPIRAQARVRYDIDAEKITGGFHVMLESTLGDLPETFEFALAPGVKVLAVRADELRGWESDGRRITARFQPGARKTLELEFHVELPALAGRDSAALALPLPSLKGAPRVEGALFVAAGDGVIVKDIATDASIRRTPTGEDKGERGFFGAFAFTGRAAGPRITLERAQPKLEADLDTLVEFRSDAIHLTRTVTLREQRTRRFSTAITLPAGEELLNVRRIEDANKESEPEWTQEGAVVRIKWSDEAAKPRVFRLRTRVEPANWTQLPAEGTTFTLGDAGISDAAKVAGYIALVADAAFRLEAQPGETLERRDGRATPVRGDYAWFRRDAFDLKVKIARRPAEVLAALTGYALPLEGMLDLHASMNYLFTGGGTRSVRIRVPKDIAQEFHFDGPGIAERALDGDVWTITFQKELTGGYALAITAQAPFARQAAADGDTAKGYSFAAKVPVISPLDVVRASGLWAIEANTETEIRFDAAGMNELDSLLAPQIPNYAPRHRVIGVFGWLGAEYVLTLNGVRHAAAGMLTAVVDRLDLNTVISTSGLHRHEAIYRLRASGVEYLDVALPRGAELLSVAIDGVAVKPVEGRPGTVRLPLPAKRDTDAQVAAAFVYETTGTAWKNRGTLALGAPTIANEIPVLKGVWRVWVPEGFSFSEIESNLPVPEVPPDELLVRMIGRVSLGAFGALRQRREGFVATGRLMVSGQVRIGDSSAVYSEEIMNFFGTQIELMQSAEVQERAHARVYALHPEMERQDVQLKVEQLPKSSIFQLRALAKSPTYATAFLDACMDEYIATKKEMRKDRTAGASVSIQDELTRLEKVMQQEETDMGEFQKANSNKLLQKDSGAVAEFEKLQSRRERTRSMYERLVESLRGMSVTRNVEHDSVSILERASQPSGALPAHQLDKAKSYTLSEPFSTDGKVMLADDAGIGPQAGRKSDLDGSTRASAASSVQITRKLNTIIFPKIAFDETSIREAFEFLAKKSKDLDPEGHGVNIVLKLGDEESAKTPITLTLNNVPLIEVIKYITNLANLKYKIEPFAVTIVPLGTLTEELYIKEWKVPPSLLNATPGGGAGAALGGGGLGAPPAGADGALTGGGGLAGRSSAKDFLAASGVTFGQGAFAMYSPTSETLVVKGTQDQLDLVERLIETATATGQPLTRVPSTTLQAATAAGDHFSYRTAGKVAGLLPVTLDLPKTGPALVFDGLYAPERLVMRYEDWWSRAKQLWLWFVGGGIAFYVFAGRRPCWGTLWAVLVLSAAPLCVSAAWTPVCNALLGGWLAGLVLNPIAAWCVFRVRKEALA